MLEALQKQVCTMDLKEKYVVTVWKWSDRMFSTCRITGPGLDIICSDADHTLKRKIFLDQFDSKSTSRMVNLMNQ